MKRLALTLAVCLLVSPAWADGYEAYFSPFDDPQVRALELLDTAQETVDIAHYNIRNEAFHQKLLELKARGVKIRITVDAKNAAHEWNTLDDTFEQEGFDIVRFENTNSKMAIMHHKFTVIDGKLVMTGSYNWNSTAQITNDENMIVIRDPKLVAGYQHEYAELRGEVPETPGVTVGSGARVYFSPEDHVQDAIRETVANAQHRILVSVFTFYDYGVARAIRDAADRGVEVWLVTEEKQATRSKADEIVAEGKGAHVIVAANRSATHSAMHHKFCVVDDHTVITGACNWTYSAFNHSNEDVVIVSDEALAARYTQAVGALVRRYAPDLFQPQTFGLDLPDGMAHFVVWHPGLDRNGQGQVFLTGDHPALGEWDPARAIPLATSDGLQPTWACRVRLPAGAQVKWKAIVKYPDGHVDWEPGSDRTALMDPQGTNSAFFATFGLDRLVRHVFEVTAPEGVPEEAKLVVTGDQLPLADWDPTQAPELTPLDKERTRWRARVDLPAGKAFQFKVVQVEGELASWEPGENHQVDVAADAVWSRSETEFHPPAEVPLPGETPTAGDTPTAGPGISDALGGN